MEKKIPKIFANEVNSKGNNYDIFYSYKVDEIDNGMQVDDNLFDGTKSVSQKISDIFSSPSYVYKADVFIKLKDHNITKKIVGKNSKYLITMDNELIPISDIVDIRKQ